MLTKLDTKFQGAQVALSSPDWTAIVWNIVMTAWFEMIK